MKKLLIIKFVRGTILFVFAFLFTGCIQRSLSELDPAMPVNISFDWKNLAMGSTAPSGMVLSFYNADGSHFLTQTCPADGFTGNLPEGTYKVLAYNGDAQGVEGRYMDTYDKAQIVASETKAVSITQASNVYGIGLGELIVSTAANAATTGTTTNTQSLTPNALAKQVTLNIGVTGEKSAISACNTTLTGVSRAVNISTGALIPEEGVISFAPSSSDKGFQSTVSIFGVIPTAANQLTTVVDFVSGGQETLTVNVTEALTNVLAGGAGGVAPVDVKLDIVVTGTVVTGFTATLTDWKIIQGDLVIK